MGSDARYDFIDILRGIAIISMIQIHCYGWWLAKGLRDTPLLAVSVMLGWPAAPVFLFLVGCVLVISIETSLKKGKNYGEITKHIIKRGLFIFLGGYIFNFAVFQYTARQNLWWAGILQCIGISILLAYPAIRYLPRFIPTTIALAIIFTTPYLRQIHFPLWAGNITSLIVNIPFKSNYSLFPSIAYVFIGIDAGKLFTKFAETPDKLKRLMQIIFAIGVLLIIIYRKPLINDVLFFSWDAFRQAKYVLMIFWYPGPNFVLFQTGVVLTLFSFLYWLVEVKGVGKLVLDPIRKMGIVALNIYVGHHLLGYRLPYSLGFMDGWYGTFSACKSSWLLGGMYAVMLAYACFWLKYRYRIKPLLKISGLH